MPANIESRIEKLEQATGSPRVALLFGEDDDRPTEHATIIVRVLFTGPEDSRHDDQDAHCDS